VYTVNSIRSQVPGAKIFLLDSSDPDKEIRDTFNPFGVTCVEFSQELREIINSHPHKSYCECLMLKTFFEGYKQEIKEFDFIYKATGRYVYEINSDPTPDKMYFKKPNQFPWRNEWTSMFPLVDLRTEEGHNYLRQYCTVLYGFGIDHLHKMTDMYNAIMHIIDKPGFTQYDVEGLTYSLSRNYKNLIEETDWIVTGFDGTSGRLMHY
jgi:hypothetical protein